MSGIVEETVDWRTAAPEALDGCRCIVTTVSGTVIDGYLRAVPGMPGSQSTRFTLADSEVMLGELRIMSVSGRHHTAILQPHVRSLTVTRGRRRHG